MSVIDESRRRIVTTGVGSLPRRHALSDLLLARMMRQPFDANALARETTEAVAEVVHKQVELGVDIISDGEQSKTSFQHYIADQLTGLEPVAPKAGERRTRENTAFPTFYKDGAHSGSQQARLACTGPIKYVGQDQLGEDIANFKAALKSVPLGVNPLGAFIPSVSPSSCAGTMENKYYKSEEEHLLAVAEALREEYEVIVAAGFEVQIDDPRLAMHYMMSPEETPEDFAQMGASPHRNPQSRAAQHSTRQDPSSHLLWNQYRAAHQRLRNEISRRSDRDDPRQILFV